MLFLISTVGHYFYYNMSLLTFNMRVSRERRRRSNTSFLKENIVYWVKVGMLIIIWVILGPTFCIRLSRKQRRRCKISF